MAVLSEVFERGVVYADKWSTEVRTALDIPDPLTAVIVEALQSGHAVVITGNAGDGKSHLAQKALASLSTRTCLEVRASLTVSENTPDDAVIFLRDAAALSDALILDTVNQALARGLPLLLTINEGPLAGLATSEGGEFFRVAREVLHARAQGGAVSDPAGVTLVDLAGRQLTESDFALRALETVLANVTPCATCGKKSKTCPRVHGAALLKRSQRGRQRLAQLLQLLTNGGRHLTARDIWVFFIDLFFGHTCPPGANSVSVDGYFWSRLFDDDTPLCQALRAEFDPVRSPMPLADVALWLGDFESLRMGMTYPGPTPVVLYRDSVNPGMEAFASAKRAYFVFSPDVDIDAVVTHNSLAPQFRTLLDLAFDDSRAATRKIVRLLNQYRMGSTTETELWVSRHHSMAAHRRASALAASAKLPVDRIVLDIPHSDDKKRYPTAGYFPDRLLVRWEGRNPTFALDFETWSQLQSRRTLAVDRDQESLDFAIDLFMAQAPLLAADDPEIRVHDHRDRVTYQLRVRHADRGFEILR